jgi:hypothetical protein
MWSIFLKLFAHIILLVKQDPTVESQKKKFKKIMQFAPEVAVLECSILKHRQGILGVN